MCTQHSSPASSHFLPLPPACSKPVAFSPHLRINSRWLAGDSRDRGAEYELFATVTHHGKSVHAGHYTADVRQADGRWVLGRESIAGDAAGVVGGGMLVLGGVEGWVACLRVCPPAGSHAHAPSPASSRSWLQFDDGQVYPVSQQAVHTARPYLLFYQRAK